MVGRWFGRVKRRAEESGAVFYLFAARVDDVLFIFGIDCSPDGLYGAVRESDGANVGGAGGAGARLAVEAAVGGGRGDAQGTRVRRDWQRGRALQDAAGRAERLDVIHSLHLGGNLGVAQSSLQGKKFC